jgi:hypothetical protein
MRQVDHLPPKGYQDNRPHAKHAIPGTESRYLNAKSVHGMFHYNRWTGFCHTVLSVYHCLERRRNGVSRVSAFTNGSPPLLNLRRPRSNAWEVDP